MPDLGVPATDIHVNPDGTIVGIIDALPGSTLHAADVEEQLADSQISGVASVKLIGSVLSAQIASLAAAKLSGTVTDAQIAGMSASKLIDQLIDAQIASLSATKLLDQIVAAQIADAAVQNKHIQAGAVGATIGNQGAQRYFAGPSYSTWYQKGINIPAGKTFIMLTGGTVFIPSSYQHDALCYSQVAAVDSGLNPIGSCTPARNSISNNTNTTASASTFLNQWSYVNNTTALIKGIQWAQQLTTADNVLGVYTIPASGWALYLIL